MNASLEGRAQEISEFLQQPYDAVLWRLQQGFHYNHKLVAEDFYNFNPKTEEDLLAFYKQTTAYLFELSCYHLDPGWNHLNGMCKGAAIHLKNSNKKKVLVVGDGIGDLSLTLYEHGLEPTYHDLYGSNTANFAQFMFERAGAKINTNLQVGWQPVLGSSKYDAVLAWDVLEHVPSQEALKRWVEAIYGCLKKNGIFQAQNAFAVGINNCEDGSSSIPMHTPELSVYAESGAWEQLLKNVGFIDLHNGWYQK